ncbi:hypothetical protein ABIF29_006219 [Bradyrhizobium elkanii]|jgi:hypothetical protein|uniref:Uncharacterized protein n=1 Tax=Bradyrhizobium elkanii TaxID=29448 RepID=A0ABV4F7I4_BRAEL|nr:hypothetical protein [Bradyrhizobium elkanii]MCP1976763.1 hypothetical protein [Bradyrhizobium elkanii]MCS3888719.1 hypothetical protein [Bradyrhizobium elkanii]MCS4212259.1 hypothetical protein [Bradyrhizobium elkanii]MCW2192106.1 hypothetical protein [Bradyrhizobium elkanii]
MICMLRLGEAWSSTQSSTTAEVDYRGNFLVRFFGEGAGNGARRIAAAASLVSRSSRSRAMFLRTLDGVPSDIHHRARSFFSGQSLSVGTRDAFR